MDFLAITLHYRGELTVLAVSLQHMNTYKAAKLQHTLKIAVYKSEIKKTSPVAFK